MEKQIASNGTSNIIVYDSGHDGVRTKQIWDKCKHSPLYFCDSDNSKIGRKVEGVLIISMDELIGKYSDYIVVLAFRKQYFDIFEPDANEVFIDAGAYDGSTVRDFILWADRGYDKKTSAKACNLYLS